LPPSFARMRGVIDQGWMILPTALGAACGRKTSVTVGTIFDKTPTALPTWFAAVWSVTAHPGAHRLHGRYASLEDQLPAGTLSACATRPCPRSRIRCYSDPVQDSVPLGSERFQALELVWASSWTPGPVVP